MYTGEVKCPLCGGHIEEFECVDTSVETDRVLIVKLGECESCHNYFKWDEYYNYDGYTYPELTEKDDEY